MKLVCPSCRAIASADIFQAEADAEQFYILATDLPTSISCRLLAYLALFRPLSGQRLRWSTALKHAIELKRLVDAGSVQYESRPARPSTAATWSEAMERMIQNPPKRLPLKSHGYLRAIAWEIANELDRTREVVKNQSERDGSKRRNLSKGRKSSDGMQPMSVEQMRAIRKENMNRRKEGA